MPLSESQKTVLSILSKNRSEESHLSGASGIHLSPRSLRYSGDIDLFHDSEEAVSDAFARDREKLEKYGFSLKLQLSQPGFIRAMARRHPDDAVLIDWAHDSAWRFMPTVALEGIGHVLHPVDLAINKVLALSGRDEARDWVDILYLDKHYVPLGTLVWAASGKDPGLNPEMLLELLQRKGKIQQRDLDRLSFASKVSLNELQSQWSNSLTETRSFIHTRPASESGHLYLKPGCGTFFSPREGDDYQLHAPQAGGVLPRFGDSPSLVQSEEIKAQLKHFFGRRLL